MLDFIIFFVWMFEELVCFSLGGFGVSVVIVGKVEVGVVLIDC